MELEREEHDLQRGLTKAVGTAAASRADAGASPPPSAISPPLGLDKDEEESAIASVRESGVGRPPSLEPEPQPKIYVKFSITSVSCQLIRQLDF